MSGLACLDLGSLGRGGMAAPTLGVWFACILGALIACQHGSDYSHGLHSM
jgi:hypothetical protein